MYLIYIITTLSLIISIVFDFSKTKQAIKIALKKLLNILPAFLKMLILVSFMLYFVPDQMIVKYLGQNSDLYGLFASLSFGSIAMMPGFIAFPLAGILVDKGVSYMNIAGFSTTLMMIGILTYPVEKKYLGHRLTILRNLISFAIAIIVTLVIGLSFGEVF